MVRRSNNYRLASLVLRPALLDVSDQLLVEENLQTFVSELIVVLPRSVTLLQDEDVAVAGVLALVEYLGGPPKPAHAQQAIG